MEIYPRLLVALLLSLGTAGLTLALYVAGLPEEATTRQAISSGSWLALMVGLGVGAGSITAIHRRFRRHLALLETEVRRLRRGETPDTAGLEVSGDLGSLLTSVRLLHSEMEEHCRKAKLERDRLTRIVDRMAEGVLLVDEKGRVELINPTFREWFRLTGELQGRSPAEVTGSHQVQVAISRAVTTGEVQHGCLDASGPAARTLQLTAVPTQVGNRSGAVVVFNDVTEMQRAIEMRRDFVANASHELKTPVSAIKAAAETLLDGALSEREAAQRFVDSIHRNAERLGRLTEDLLSLSRLEGHATSLERKPVDVAVVIEELCDALKDTFADAGLHLSCEPSPGLPEWVGDRRALEQILANLMDNARSYTPEGGTVEVAAFKEGGGLSVCVRDTGIGIEPRHLPRLFERFYRVDPARSRAAGGTGLGLSLVKHLSEALGGKVEVESTLGTGSTFTVHFPGSNHD